MSSAGQTRFRLALSAGFLVSTAAAQLVLPADGQPAFVGSGWHGGSVSASLPVDLNADGYPDLVMGALHVVTAVNNGHGVWRTVTQLDDVVPRVNTLAAGDIDLDGRTDLVQLGTAQDEVALLLRRTAGANPWASIGGGIPGAAGQPRLVGTGEPLAGQLLQVDVDHAAPGALTFLVASLELLDQPFKGGRLVPAPTVVLPVGFVGTTGELHLESVWSGIVPAGTVFWLQLWFGDATAAHGLSATGGMRLRVP